MYTASVCVCPAGWGNPPRLIGDLDQTGASPLGDFSQGLLPGTGAPGMVVQMVSLRASHFAATVGSMTAEWQEFLLAAVESHGLPAMGIPGMLVLTKSQAYTNRAAHGMPQDGHPAHISQRVGAASCYAG